MRLINAEDVIIRLRVNPEEWGTPDESWLPEREYAMAIMTSPEIDPVKHGRWMDGTCSECGKHAVWRVMLRGEVVWEDAYEFCPHCGARMDEVSE